MIRHKVLWIFLGLALATLRLSAAAPAVDAPANPDDWRTLRELQNKATGAPELPPDPGSQGDLLISAATLGSQAAAGGLDKTLQAEDYDALYSLLQRYRDELAGMGLDYDKLITRLDELKRKSEDLSDRIDKFHPLDGVKIHGRYIGTYSDLHIVGPADMTEPVFSFGTPTHPKDPGKGIRFQAGINRADMDFELVRGPLEGLMEFNMESVWGGNSASMGFRRFYIEARLPVTAQLGQIDTNLTPLTLWRNEDPYPYEPEPFKSRRERARKDFELLPNELRLSGARFSTEVRLFDSFSVNLESTSALLNPLNGTPAYFLPNFVTSSAGGPMPLSWTSVVNTNYMEAWRISAPLPAGLKVAYQGALLFDLTDSTPLNPTRQMSELAQSGQVTFKNGGFYLNGEFAGSSYNEPTLTYTAQTSALLGSAIYVDAGYKGKVQSFRAYARQVSSGYHAAGAQVRTQDANYNYLGPLMTDITQVNTDGGVGIAKVGWPVIPGMSLPVSMEQVWNTQIITPGAFIANSKTASVSYAGKFAHLLPYDYLNDISPYGMATPNRQGFGAEGQWALFGGLLVPKLGFDMATNIDPVYVSPTSGLWMVDNVANTITGTKPLVAPFSYQQVRAGLDVNFTMIYPITISGGYTMHDTRNGQSFWVIDPLSKAKVYQPFVLSSTLLQGGIAVHPRETVTVAIGYQHVDASGFSDVIVASRTGSISYDEMAYSVFWYLTKDARVDFLYQDLTFNSQSIPSSAFSAGTALCRFGVEF